MIYKLSPDEVTNRRKTKLKEKTSKRQKLKICLANCYGDLCWSAWWFCFLLVFRSDGHHSNRAVRSCTNHSQRACWGGREHCNVNHISCDEPYIVYFCLPRVWLAIYRSDIVWSGRLHPCHAVYVNSSPDKSGHE